MLIVVFTAPRIHTWNCTLSNKFASSFRITHLLFEMKTMAAATQLGMSASSFLCPTSITSKRVESTYSRPSTTLIVCQQADVSRRVFAVAGAAAATTLIRVPEAQARRKTPPPEEKKKVELEDKNLSAYDARVLANARRKEAMKETVEAAKAKAKSIAPSIAQTPRDQ